MTTDERWQKWFAWYPVMLPSRYAPNITGKYVWLRTVYRRPFGVSSDSFYWEYDDLIGILKHG